VSSFNSKSILFRASSRQRENTIYSDACGLLSCGRSERC
jgi:hypothetical protein